MTPRPEGETLVARLERLASHETGLLDSERQLVREAIAALTPPASAPGSGEDAELMRELARLELATGKPLRTLRAAAVAALSRARAEGEAKGRREALSAALASAPDGPWIAFIGTKAPNGTCVRVFHKTQTHTFDLDSITTPKLHERPKGGAYDTELEGRSVCAILNLIANGDVK